MLIDISAAEVKLLDILLSAHEDACAEQHAVDQLRRARADLALVRSMRSKITSARANLKETRELLRRSRKESR